MRSHSCRLSDGSARRGRALVLALVTCVSLAASRGLADDLQPTGGPVIPPDEEGVVAAMLGTTTGLPYCTFAGGGVHYDVIEATYGCLGGDLTVRLAHPQTAPVGSISTAQFAITIRSGTPPPDFLAAFVSLVRSREADFAWVAPERDGDAMSDDAAE